jgi:hypothetical protein
MVTVLAEEAVVRKRIICSNLNRVESLLLLCTYTRLVCAYTTCDCD